MLEHRVRGLLSRISFREWSFKLTESKGALFLQVRFEAPDTHTGVVGEQCGRKWYLSEYMTDSEVVQTAYAAIAMAEEHERREDFLFDGERVFGPHFNVEVLAEVAATVESDARQHIELARG